MTAAIDPALILEVQRAYPQIYLACHTKHTRAASNAYRLSARDSALLSHLQRKRPISAGHLARHLGISASTLSAAIKRLTALGYVARQPNAKDRREVGLGLTPRGVKAMSGSSVLDSDRVAGVLSLLPSSQRRRAIAGLALFADAARRFQKLNPNGKNFS